MTHTRLKCSDCAIRITYHTAMAIARECATNHMFAEGRVRWDESDWLIAAQMFDEIMGEQGRQS